MADEITLTLAMSLTNGYFKDTFTPGTINVTQSAIGGYGAVVIVGSSAEEDLTTGDVATLGWLFLRNLDTTNYVTYGAKDTTMKAFGRIKAGEWAALRLEPGITLRWQANTAPVKVQVILLEN